MYKLSKYNYVVENDQRIIHFNGMTGHSFSLSKDEHGKITELFNDLISFHIQYTTVFNRFKEWGFIVDENTDEVDIIRYRNREAVFLDRFYRLIINPTEECIFNCWYCTQHKSNTGCMRPDMIDRVKKHINITIENNIISGLMLDWFGGEPLMYFDEVIYPISKHAIELVEQRHLPFTQHVTTNAYLITPDMVNKMKEIRLNSFQITIDGDEKRHNLIRNINGKPTFKRIMENITRLCENIPDAKIILRLNYDDKTFKIGNLQSVYEQIPQHFRHQITLDFQRVWQTIQTIKKTDDTDKLLNKPLFELRQHIASLGFTYTISNALGSGKRVQCYADRFFHTVINYNGKIYKCTANLDREAGILHDDGNIIWNKETINSLYSRATFENKKCLQCKYLPLCLGPCTQKVKDRPKDIPCVMDSTEIPLEQFIIDTYERKINNIKEKTENLEPV